MENEITVLLELFAQFGFSSVFLWLFVREMNRHDQTRTDYREDMRDRIRHAENEAIRCGSQPRTPAELPNEREGTDKHTKTP
jgi:hypothetical protein